MNDAIMAFKHLLGLIGAFFGYFIGGNDGLMFTLLIFIIIDYVTGVMVAIEQKKISSEVGFKGIAKKVFIFLLVGIGNLIDVNVIGEGATFRTAVIFFYLANEGISILENGSNLGLPIPKKLKDVLAQLKEDGGGE